MYIGWDGREYEDAEMDNMRRDAQEARQESGIGILTETARAMYRAIVEAHSLCERALMRIDARAAQNDIEWDDSERNMAHALYDQQGKLYTVRKALDDFLDEIERI
jgi:phenylalanine-4-hydroxylase